MLPGWDFMIEPQIRINRMKMTKSMLRKGHSLDVIP